MPRTDRRRQFRRPIALGGAVALGAALLLVPTGTAVAAPIRVLGYVANNGGGVSVLDTATDTVSSTLSDSNGGSPYGVGVAFDGARGYVTNVRDNTLTVIDTPTNTVDAAVPVGDGPAGVVVSPSGAHVYVSNYRAGTVSVVDAATLTATETIPVGPNADGVALTPDGSRLYVAHDVVGAGTVTVVDTATNAVVTDIATGNTPTAVAVTPDGTKLLVVNKFSNNVAVVSVATNAVIGTIPVSFIPHGIAISPDGNRAYVTNSEGHSLSVLDIPALAPVTAIAVGNRPIGVALTPDGTKAYVTNFTGGTVSIVDTTTLSVANTIPVGTNPVGIAIHAVPAAPTSLVAGYATLQLRLVGFTVRGMSATLKESHTGNPVVGKTVAFRTLKGHPLCTAVTNSSGKAACNANVPLLVGLATLLQGYTAAFPGDSAHGPSRAHGWIGLL
ncbi:YncE family protein [Actinosynnema sp. NPDC047251]|uniref:YVTN family beta-propeller repeat protein n=1 Tax=Saccharothrix espanaensis (strain ATCC 51144 / DSM 44229 / JCM 9112 / NBRC 15066 / NRRL 15764) TaxID=1179773 RepID=K0JV37_SACES|nr:YncE family protein [Saccharothrix espanaensis]CCH29856.1 YVTN family beta-propeller repeat protein [Saccharothrix espanaensis DSM 44229]